MLLLYKLNQLKVTAIKSIKSAIIPISRFVTHRAYRKILVEIAIYKRIHRTKTLDFNQLKKCSTQISR